MTTTEQIRSMADMMRLNIDDADHIIPNIQTIMEYFRILDTIDDDADITHTSHNIIPLDKLRSDHHIPSVYERDGYIRAPGLG